jgi:hypothetical protein
MTEQAISPLRRPMIEDTDAGPGACGSTYMGPASEKLNRSGPHAAQRKSLS